MKTLYRLPQPLLLFLLLLCGTTIKAQFPGWQWAQNFDGTDATIKLGNVATDVSGNIYVTGGFSGGTFVLGTTTLVNTGATDIFIAKYDPNGILLWARSEGGSDHDVAYDIDVDLSGNIVIGGVFYSSALPIGSTTLTKPSSLLPNGDLFLAKFDAVGNPLWALSGGGNRNDFVTKVHFDINGNVFLAGDFSSQTLTLGSTILTNVTATSNLYDAFISKCDPSGNFLWTDHIASNGYDNCSGLSADGAGNIYVSGYFSGLTLTAGNMTTVTSYTINSQQKMYIIKYNGSGQNQWVKTNGRRFGDGPELHTDMAGNVYSAASYSAPTLVLDNYTVTVPNYPPGDNLHTYLSKYDTNGNLIWVRNILSSSFSFPTALSEDASGNIFIGGWSLQGSTNSMTFEPVSVANYGWGDLFLAKYDPQGNLGWATIEGGLLYEDVQCLTADPSGSAIIAGFHGDTLTLGATTLPGHVQGKLFFAKTGSTLTSLKENTVNEQLHIFPNPFSSLFHLSSDISLDNAEVVIRNSLGQTVKELDQLSGHAITISCPELPPGPYTIGIRENGKVTAVKKAVKLD